MKFNTRKALRISLKVLLSIITFFAIVLLAGYLFITSKVKGDVDDLKSTPSVLSLVNKTASPSTFDTIPTYDSVGHEFKLSAFKNPPLKYGPFTRWWWPGADVEKEELIREIKMFSEVGIAGVEIQPFLAGLNPADEAAMKKIKTFGSTTYYDILRSVLQQANKSGISVDLNAGSGWPLGGKQNNIDDGFKQLLFSEETVKGNKSIDLKLPHPNAPLSSYVTQVFSLINEDFVSGNQLYEEKLVLRAVVAAKVKADNRSGWAYKITDQVELDENSVVVLTDKVDNGTLNWDVPEGEWKVIAIWSAPSAEIPSLYANNEKGFVVDHFDKDKVLANYEYLFGQETSLAPYYGNGLRAIFNDSYEFKADRHFTDNFIAHFKNLRGYDITPFLPVVFKPGNDHVLGRYFFGHSKPDFIYSEEDWRIRHDYDATLSDLFIENFLENSNDWMQKRNIKHRSQTYGNLKLDAIKAAGSVHIPETEQLFAEGSETAMRLISSGANLHNKPLVTCESLVYQDRPYMTTPQKIKVAVDKAFTSGVNQIVYHGTAYKYEKEYYGHTGWYPFSSEFLPAGFAFDNRETNVFWKYQPQINNYIRRVQYALQSGDSSVDVLIYFPFKGLHHLGDYSRSDELLVSGWFKDVEPAIESSIPSFGGDKADEVSEWLQNIFELIDVLDENGITWNWVNDESLQSANYKDNNMNIRNNEFVSVLIPSVPYMELKTSENLLSLTEVGANVVFEQTLPEKQPSFYDHINADRKLKKNIESIIKGQPSAFVESNEELNNWAKGLDIPIRIKKSNPDIRQVRRINDSTVISFYRNTNSKPSKLSVDVSEDYSTKYWLAPMTGEKYDFNEGNIMLPGYGSTILYASVKASPIEDDRDTPTTKMPLWYTQKIGKPLIELNDWRISTEDKEVSTETLEDLRNNKEFCYSKEPITYRTEFEVDGLDSNSSYHLDIADAFFVAEITINGVSFEPLLYKPYKCDISTALKKGENTLEIKVSQSQFNEFVGRAINGDKAFKRFKSLEEKLMPIGLEGPVSIIQLSE